MRLLAKPVVDVILSGGDPDAYPRPKLLQQGAGLLQRDLDDIQSSLKQCLCSKRPLHPSEPYASLAKNLSADNASLSRRDLTRSTGEGLLLRDLVAAQRDVGICDCKGRQG